MKKGTARAYSGTISNLTDFIYPLKDIDISDINTNFLRRFEEYLLQRVTSNSSSTYFNCIRGIHSAAKREFNEEDRGVIHIPFSPFEYFEAKEAKAPKKRAITTELMQAIIDFKPKKKQSVFGRDCFLLSFGLIGMNAIDLHSAKADKKNILVYNRTKTKDRRADDAEMRVMIEPCIAELVEKYRDKTGVRMFNFYKRHETIDGLNCYLSRAMKALCAEMGIEPITFYAARHTWATIARSAACGIDKYTVHEALNHSDPEMRITDMYIERDWTVIWNANKKVLGLFDF